MNEEQVKSAIRSLVSTFGGAIAGWFAAKGWFSVDDVLHVLNSPTVISIIASAIMGGWGLIVHTQKNAVAVVDAIAKDPASPVKGVVTTATPAGRELAESMPGNTTVPAGSPAATSIAAIEPINTEGKTP